MAKLHLKTMKNFLKEQGAERISNQALVDYRAEVEKFASVFAEKVVLTTKNAKRKVVHHVDVNLVSRLLW